MWLRLCACRAAPHSTLQRLKCCDFHHHSILCSLRKDTHSIVEESNSVYYTFLLRVLYLCARHTQCGRRCQSTSPPPKLICNRCTEIPRQTFDRQYQPEAPTPAPTPASAPQTHQRVSAWPLFSTPTPPIQSTSTTLLHTFKVKNTHPNINKQLSYLSNVIEPFDWSPSPNSTSTSSIVDPLDIPSDHNLFFYEYIDFDDLWADLLVWGRSSGIGFMKVRLSNYWDGRPTNITMDATA